MSKHDEKEKQYRQFLSAKALYYAIEGNEAKAESIRYFLRKIAEKEDTEIQFPSQNMQSIKKAA